MYFLPSGVQCVNPGNEGIHTTHSEKILDLGVGVWVQVSFFHDDLEQCVKSYAYVGNRMVLLISEGEQWERQLLVLLPQLVA